MYHCGVFGAPPYITCDSYECGAYVVIDGLPPKWFMDRKPPPRWSGSRVENANGSVTRLDYCPRHRQASR